MQKNGFIDIKHNKSTNSWSVKRNFYTLQNKATYNF